MPLIFAPLTASAASGKWRDERINDDRFYADPACGLAFVVDASGPTYGGYHAPFAIDPGITALVEAFGASDELTRERLVTSVHTAHATMRAMNERYEAVRAGRVGLEAARRAADAVRPSTWEGYDSYAHFVGSLTVCAVGRDTVIVAQIGQCRAYRLSDGCAELLARDHTLASVLEASAASPEEVEQARRDHSHVVVAFLGGETLPLNVVEVAHPARLALVTDGVWRCEAALGKLSHASTQQDVQRVVAECASTSGQDATAVVFEVR